jgi:hypothetical protein
MPGSHTALEPSCATRGDADTAAAGLTTGSRVGAASSAVAGSKRPGNEASTAPWPAAGDTSCAEAGSAALAGPDNQPMGKTAGAVAAVEAAAVADVVVLVTTKGQEGST